MKKEKIAVKISPAQLRLLQDKVTIPDDNLKRAVSLALKRDDYYEIILTLTDLEALCEAIIVSPASSKNLRAQLDDLHDFFDNIFWEVGEDLLMDIADIAGKFDPEKEFDDEEEEEEEFDDEDELEQPENISQLTGPVYIFKVMLDDNLWRCIALRSGQTLHDLHEAIFKAFNRFDEHLYSFYFPRSKAKFKNPWTMVQKSTEYTHPFHLEETYDPDQQKHNAAQTTIAGLSLKPQQIFWYLFDFGDEWWHQIVTQKTNQKPSPGRYPRITEKKGKSPPQYEY